MWKANGAMDLPLADRAMAWEADAAEARVRKWAGGEEDMDWGKYRKAFFAYDDERADQFGGYKLQFADIVDGALRAVPRGVMAVAAALEGSRGGVDLPQDVQNEIRQKVAAYYHKWDEQAPWERRSTPAVREGRVLSEKNRQLIAEAIRQTKEAIQALQDLLDSTALPAEERRAVVEELHAVRRVGPDRIGGYAVVWGGRDLYGTTFTPETDFWLERYPQPPLLYDHGFDATLGATVLGRVERHRQDDIGLWVEAQLEIHEQYRQAIGELLDKGVLGFSTGSAKHLVEVGPDGVIRRWPIVEVSLTPTPAEPRTLGVKELRAISVDEALLAVEAAQTDVSESEPATEEQSHQDEVKEMETQAIQVQGQETKAAEPIVEKAGLFAVKRVTKLGFADDAMRSWLYWLRTGDHGAVRAALQEDTPSEGGYLVPDDFYTRVVQKLSEQSIARAMGAQVIRTSRDIIRVPVEGTSMSNFAVTSEEGSYNENEPTFGELALTIYKFTKLVKVSEELLEDEAAAPSLPDLLANMFARAMATTENTYFLVGSGSGQPQGAVTGGTMGVRCAATSAITAGEVVDLYFSLPSQYRERPNVCFVMADSTEKVIRKIQATASAGEFLFQVTPGGSLETSTLLGKRVWNSSAMPSIAASAKVILFGDWEYYYIAERSGLVVERNPYLYQANGQIGLFAKFRLGGGVANADAFQYMAMATG